jgi:glycosyltransferase involved in cell wall biosynthesis
VRLYCSTPEKYPIRLVDVTELFFRELRTRGVEQTWFCRAGAQSGGLRREWQSGVGIIVPPSLPGDGIVAKALTYFAYWFFELVFLLKQIGRPPDAILIRDKYWGAFVGYLVARICGCRFMVWLSYPYPEHDSEEAQSATGWRRSLKRVRASLGRRILYQFAMPRADHCFVQSEQMKKDLLHWGISPDKMTAVPMGITTRVFDSADLDAPPASPPVVLYLGTLAGVRKLEILVDAFALVLQKRPDVRLQFVGDGDVPAERQKLEERVRHLNLSAAVEFTGQLPMDEAWKKVAAASVCLSPFRVTPVLRVASPTKFVEYLAFAKATVANDHPEHSMIAAKSSGALIVEWTPEAFAEGILWCLDHPEEAREMALRGRVWIRDNRTYDRLADQVLHQLEAVIAGRAVGSA